MLKVYHLEGVVRLPAPVSSEMLAVTLGRLWAQDHQVLIQRALAGDKDAVLFLVFWALAYPGPEPLPDDVRRVVMFLAEKFLDVECKRCWVGLKIEWVFG